MYLEILDTDKMKRSFEKTYLTYLEAYKMRGEVEESSNEHFQLVLGTFSNFAAERVPSTK